MHLLCTSRASPACNHIRNHICNHIRNHLCQTLVMDLTGMELCNASLLDESSAAAEAMTMIHGEGRGKKKIFFVRRRALFNQLFNLRVDLRRSAGAFR